LARDIALNALARAIVALITNESLRWRLAENAYNYAKQFTWDRIVEEFLRVLELVTSRKSQSLLL